MNKVSIDWNAPVVDEMKKLEELTNGNLTSKVKYCSNCGKEIGANGQKYSNGEGFCCESCEKTFYNKQTYGFEISDVLKKNILPIYRDTTEAELRANLVNPAVLDKVLSWKMGAQGLALIGRTGCGKTRSAALLLKRLISVDLVGIKSSLMVYYAGELERAIMESFGNKAKSYAELMRRLETCGLLVIDDFGKEKFTERYEVSVFQIFEKRTASRLPIIFTTNYKGESLKARFSDQNNYEPFSRRLNEFCDRVVFTRKER